MLGNTLAASLIWGINTIFLLDAGLSNLEAFAANAFFTAGMVIFEIPTGIVADTIGRRVSYLLGTLTLSAASLLYVLLWRIDAPFWEWAVASASGLGFTFFSGRGRGVARRRADRHRLHRRSGDGLRPRPGRHGRRDADRLGRRGLPRPAGQPRLSVRPPWRDPDRHVRRRIQAHARRRLHRP